MNKLFTHRFDLGKVPCPPSVFSSAHSALPACQGCTEAVAHTPQHVVPWLSQGPSAHGSALSLLPLLEAQMLTKRGSDLTVTAGPGRGKDTHSPVEATEELGAIRGEAE